MIRVHYPRSDEYGPLLETFLQDYYDYVWLADTTNKYLNTIITMGVEDLLYITKELYFRFQRHFQSREAMRSHTQPIYYSEIPISIWSKKAKTIKRKISNEHITFITFKKSGVDVALNKNEKSSFSSPPSSTSAKHGSSVYMCGRNPMIFYRIKINNSF